MHSSPHEAGLSLVDQESVPGEVDEEPDEVHQRVAVSEELIAKLQRELEGVADQEAEIAQRLDSDRQRRAALDRQLHKARKEAASLMLAEASQTSSAMLAEAEQSLQDSRLEAGRIAKEAFDQAKEMIAESKEMVAEAKAEGVAIVVAGQKKLSAFEDDAAQRLADLDSEYHELTQRLGVMETVYNELQATLRLVAETSLEELVTTQESVKQLDSMETQDSPPEPKIERTTSESPPEEGSVADIEAPSDSAGDEPDSIEIPALTTPEPMRPN
jgi:chromosome segregation ATPase